MKKKITKIPKKKRESKLKLFCKCFYKNQEYYYKIMLNKKGLQIYSLKNDDLINQILFLDIFEYSISPSTDPDGKPSTERSVQINFDQYTKNGYLLKLRMYFLLKSSDAILLHNSIYKSKH